MTTDELARILRARREGKNYRGKCPVHEPHKRYGRGLGLYPKQDRTKVVCYAGCDTRDILAAAGLHLRDIFYTSRDSSSEALKAFYEQRKLERQRQQEQRVKDLSVVIAALNCPPVRTKDSFTRDIEAAYRAH